MIPLLAPAIFFPVRLSSSRIQIAVYMNALQVRMRLRFTFDSTVRSAGKCATTVANN